MKLGSFRRNRRGTTAVVFTTSSLGLLCVAGLAIDSGNIVTARRALQGCTDLAAISAASNVLTAQAWAVDTAAANGYAAGDVASVTTGIYTADPSITPAQRFQPAPAAAANAVMVTMTHAQPLFFSNLFNLASGASFASTAPITTQAIAAVQRVAAFDIGSGVAAFNGGIVNAVLAASIGSGASLSLLDYNALAGAQVNLFSLGQALSAEVGKVGETYGQAYSGTVSLAQFLAALQQAAPSVAPELQSLVNAAGTSNATVNLAQLFDPGPYATQSVTAPLPSTTATTSVLSLVQAALQLGGAPHLISFSLGSVVPGVASVQAQVTIGEPAQGTTLFAADHMGTTVHTSQVRLYMQVQLTAAVAGASVNVPLYVEAGYGTATFNGLSCTPLDSSGTQVSLGVTPGLLNGWIGNVTSADMTNYSQEPAPTTATLLNLAGIATVTGRATATVGNATPVQVSYDATDIQNVVMKTTSTTDFAGSLVTSLIGNLQLQVNVLGPSILVPPGLTTGVDAALTAASPSLDTLISSVLQTVGVGVGRATTWVTGAGCGAATLAG